jgi:chromosomal replication initiation ATPase DnaA
MPALAKTVRREGIAPAKASEAERRVALEEDRLFRIRYLIGSAYGVGHDELISRPSSVKAALARSLAIAVARDILSTDLAALARHFGCTGPSEAAEHCNRIARRFENDHRFAAMTTFARATCAAALGLDS